LKEWYGKTDESQWTTLRRLPYVWPNERWRGHWVGAKLFKDAFFSDGIKKNLWNAGTSSL